MAKQLTLNLDAGRPRPTGKYAERLLALDSTRWEPFKWQGEVEELMDDPDLEMNQIETDRQLMYSLATWCFDSGYLDEQDTQRDLLKRIKATFGPMMRYRVLICMQTRRHDT